MSLPSCLWVPRRLPVPSPNTVLLSEVESTAVPGCRMPPCIPMQALEKRAKGPALTCTGPCPACSPAAGQGSHAVSPWHARPAAPGSCCCPRNSRDCRHYTPPGRHGPSSGSAHSSWGCPGVRERTLTERQKNLGGGEAFTWAALSTFESLYIVPQQISFQRSTSVSIWLGVKRGIVS